jgi:hypothetical protein
MYIEFANDQLVTRLSASLGKEQYGQLIDHLYYRAHGLGKSAQCKYHSAPINSLLKHYISHRYHQAQFTPHCDHLDHVGPDAHLDFSTVHTVEGNSDTNSVISEYITVYILHKNGIFPRISLRWSILHNHKF